METRIVIISGSLFLLGIIILIRSLKSSKRNSEHKIQELELIRKINTNNAKQEIDVLTKILKQYIKKTTTLNEKLSLNELIKELDKKQEKDLRKVCNSFQEYYYTGKQPTRKTNEKLKKDLILVIKLKERELKRKEITRKQNQTILDKVKTKEEEVKEKIKKQKVNHQKLKQKKK